MAAQAGGIRWRQVKARRTGVVLPAPALARNGVDGTKGDA